MFRLIESKQFIKKYIQELSEADIKSIHDPLKYSLWIIINHREAQRLAKEVYKESSTLFNKMRIICFI